MKFFKKKNLLNVLYAILIGLPLFAILGRVLYTQWNSNAKDSYYGENINEEIVNTITELHNGQYYYFDVIRYSPLFDSDTTNITIYTDKIYNAESSYAEIDLFNPDEVKIIRFLNNGTNNNYVSFRDGNDGILKNIPLAYYTLKFEFYSYSNINLTTQLENLIYTKTFNKYSYLDNAFDYSISQFVSENDFGKLNFFTWFSDLFLSNNAQNTLYINFVNWYLNYTLFVSLGYILFLVLMWFVNFARSILCKFEDKPSDLI